MWRPTKASRMLEAAQLAGWEVDDQIWAIILERGNRQVRCPFRPDQVIPADYVELLADSLGLTPRDL